ncbi:MAG: NrfD/PsrC family molybdoenzyme membrane anchor subunit [Actinomycetales bacterium]
MSPRGERAMVPPAQPTSYYGRPILKAPTWHKSNVAGYLFLGGLAGGSALLAGGAEMSARPTMARSTKVVALGAISLSTAALVHDLGRPSRFVNMLRVLKPTSPMSVGSWILAAFAPAAGLATLSDVSGRLPRIGRVATMSAAALGPLVASYTSVLIADTAVPAWHDAHRELPFVFVGSAGAASAGAALITSPAAEAGPARRLAVASVALETAASARLERGPQIERRSFRTGRPAALLKAAKVLAVGGAALAVLGRRSRLLSASAGAGLLAGSLLTRLGVYEAGVASSQDPAETVEGQRTRSLQSR